MCVFITSSVDRLAALLSLSGCGGQERKSLTVPRFEAQWYLRLNFPDVLNTKSNTNPSIGLVSSQTNEKLCGENITIIRSFYATRAKVAWSNYLVDVMNVRGSSEDGMFNSYSRGIDFIFLEFSWHLMYKYFHSAFLEWNVRKVQNVQKVWTSPRFKIIVYLSLTHDLYYLTTLFQLNVFCSRKTDRHLPEHKARLN